MSDTQEIKSALKAFFGFESFKGQQLEIISSLLEGNDVFVLMPTGGGKSLCYQLPALMSEGTAIIVSPLIALMKNQVDAIRHHAADDSVAHFLNSSLSRSALQQVKADVKAGKTKMLYVAPESLTKQPNIDFLSEIPISFYAIDEAHCISEWGHDFRPEYRRIRHIINAIGPRPVIALTATATPKVQLDIQKTLSMMEAKVFKSSFNRPNLSYEVRPKTKNTDRDIVKFIKAHPGQSGIIYCLSRKRVDELSEALRVNDIKALPYHAGLDAATRALHQDNFLNERADIIVATIAFGMGIDKPDVRYVIHYDIPKSLEGYYQETGRAGRDGMAARCICFYSHKDIQKLDKLMQSKPANEQEIGRRLLAETAAYAETAACRRLTLLHYFGEQYNHTHCSNCDNCLSPAQPVDKTELLSDILDTVEALGSSAAYSLLIYILLGIGSEEIRRNGYDKLPAFGTASDLEEHFLHTVLRQAAVQGYLSRDIDKESIVSITAKGRGFIDNPVKFEVVKDRDFSEADYTDTHEAPGGNAADQQLYKILKGLRQDMAARRGLPPYVIFSDLSLESMATIYPLTQQELLTVPGVGQGKANRFGKEFLQVIARYVEENEVERPTDIRVRTLPGQHRLDIYIIKGVDRRIDLDMLAKGKGISIEEVLDTLEAVVARGQHIDITYYLSALLDDDDRMADLLDYFRDTDEDDIQAAFKELGSEYTEEEIRLGRVKFISDTGN